MHRPSCHRVEEVLVSALVDQRAEPTVLFFEQLAGLVEFDLDRANGGITMSVRRKDDDDDDDAPSKEASNAPRWRWTYDATCVQNHLGFVW